MGGPPIYVIRFQNVIFDALLAVAGVVQSLDQLLVDIFVSILVYRVGAPAARICR